MQKLRIAVLVGDFSTGGGQIAAFRLAEVIGQQHDVYLVNARPSLVSEFDETLWPNVTVISTVETDDEVLPGHLAKIFKSLEIDLMHSHIWWADRLAMQIKNLHDIPWISTLHGCQEYLFETPGADVDFLRWAREFYQKVNGIAYLSEKNLIGLNRFGLPPFTPVRQIYNCLPVNAAPFRPLRRGGDPVRFVLASRAIAEKGWDTALRAVALVEEIFPNRLHLMLVGSGPYIEDARQLAAQLDLSAHVTFSGHTSAPMKIMSECDVGVLPSRFTSESLPNSIVEYLASGLAVIASSVGEIPNMISNGPAPSGILLPASSPMQMVHDLAGAMLTYIQNPGLRDAHARNALPRFDAFFSKEKAARGYINLYEDAIGAHSEGAVSIYGETMPRFIQDKQHSPSSKSDIIFVEKNGEMRAIVSLNVPTLEVNPSDDIYPMQEFVRYDKILGGLLIQLHPKGPVRALIGPFYNSPGVRLAEIGLNVIYSTDAPSSSINVSMAVADSEGLARNPLDRAEFHQLNTAGSGAKILVSTPEMSNWYIACTVESVEPLAAPYLRLGVTCVTLIEGSDR